MPSGNSLMELLDGLVMMYHISAHKQLGKVREHMFTNYMLVRALTTFTLEGEVTSLSESSQGEVEDNREKWVDFWEKLMAINQNIVLQPL